jgi:hypothetical protein
MVFGMFLPGTGRQANVHIVPAELLRTEYSLALLGGHFNEKWTYYYVVGMCQFFLIKNGRKEKGKEKREPL